MASSVALERAEGSGPNLKGIIDIQQVEPDRPQVQRWIAGESGEIPDGGRL
jgi:hypothetical protein